MTAPFPQENAQTLDLVGIPGHDGTLKGLFDRIVLCLFLAVDRIHLILTRSPRARRFLLRHLLTDG